MSLLHKRLGQWLLATVLATSSGLVASEEFSFDWVGLTWLDGSYVQTYTVTGSEGTQVDVRFTVIDPGDATNPAGGGDNPGLGIIGAINNELVIFPDFPSAGADQEVRVIIEFFVAGTTNPFAVTVENLTIRDIDSGNNLGAAGETLFADGVSVQALIFEGVDVSPNDVQLPAGADTSVRVNAVNRREFAPGGEYATAFGDAAGEVSLDFDRNELIQSIEITHFPADDSGYRTPVTDPAPQAISISAFSFYDELPLALSKSISSSGPYGPGDVIDYEISLTNNRVNQQSLLSLIDVLESNAQLVPGSAFVTGPTETPAPSIEAEDLFDGADFGFAGSWSTNNANIANGALNLEYPGCIFIFFCSGGTPDASRTLDIDLSTALSATLTFDQDTDLGLYFLFVDASVNGGPFTQLAQFGGAATAREVDLTSVVGPGNNSVALRFRGSSSLLGAPFELAIDNVQVEVTRDSTRAAPSYPELIEPSDPFILPIDAVITATYSITVPDPAPLTVFNRAVFDSEALPNLEPREAFAATATEQSCEGGVSGEVEVTREKDDGWYDDDSPKFTDEKEMELGKGDNPDTGGAFLFRNISIPAGAQVTGVRLRLMASSDDSGGNPLVSIRAINDPDFDKWPGRYPNDPLTSAFVNWDLSDSLGASGGSQNWSKGATYNSPLLDDIVQELVDENGGLNDQNIALLLEATGGAVRKAYQTDEPAEDENGAPPTLVIGYTCLDYGDAPASYGDASHELPLPLNVFLGSPSDAPDSEAGTLNATNDALGDDSDNIDDENGVIFSIPTGGSLSGDLTVTATVTTNTRARVCVWIDDRGNTGGTGSFSAGDAQCTGGVGNPDPTANGSVTFDFAGVLSPGESGSFYARVRITSDLSMGTGNATGNFSDGEAEDYQVLYNLDPTAVTLGRVELLSTTVEDFLDGVGASTISTSSLRSILATWTPELADSLEYAERDELIRAMEDYLDPDRDGRVALLAWDTLEERGTIGFYVERREQGKAWQRVNNRLLPGLITAPLGGQYQLADPAAQPGRSYQYRLIEQEARGDTRTYGPFDLGM